MPKKKDLLEGGPDQADAQARVTGLEPNSYFLMHIAKTAGSFVNAVLEAELGSEFVAHCESPSRLSTKHKVSVWSGHIYLCQWRGIAKQNSWDTKFITLLREPTAQLASHIQWLDHYADPAFRMEYDQLDRATQEVVDQVAATDLSDPGDIDRFLLSLSGRSVQYFDNCQSRYFIAAGNDIGRQEPLHLGMRHLLRKSMNDFALIGLSENMDDFISKLSSEFKIELKGMKRKVNEAKSTRKIDVANPLIRSVLAKRCTLDNWLYAQAKKDLA